MLQNYNWIYFEEDMFAAGIEPDEMEDFFDSYNPEF